MLRLPRCHLLEPDDRLDGFDLTEDSGGLVSPDRQWSSSRAVSWVTPACPGGRLRQRSRWPRISLMRAFSVAFSVKGSSCCVVRLGCAIGTKYSLRRRSGSIIEVKAPLWSKAQ
jgi:hypothetical protein